MNIFLYIFWLLVSFVVEFGVGTLLTEKFLTSIFDEGYKIDYKFFTSMLKKDYEKNNLFNKIIGLIPGLNIIQAYILIQRRFKKIKKDPKFIANLVSLSLSDKLLIDEINDSRCISAIIKRLGVGFAICDDVSIPNENMESELYPITKKEIKSYSLPVIKETIDTLVNINEEKIEERTPESPSLYVLPGEYNLSSVFKFDDNATFIKTNTGTKIAVLNAELDEVHNFMRKSIVIQPSLEDNYHIVSLKPFDKEKTRATLLEIENIKETRNKVIDARKFKMRKIKDAKKRAL